MAGKPPPNLFEFQSHGYSLVPTGQSADDLDLRSRKVEAFREQPHHRRIGSAIRRSFRDTDFQFFLTVPANSPAADPRLGRTRCDPDRDLTLHHFGWSISLQDG